VAEEIRASGGAAVAAAGDVTDYDDVRDFVSRAESALAPIDILVNNAGLPVGRGFVLREFHETDPGIWEPWLAVSLHGVLHCCRAVVVGMRERGWGRIITISSDAGLRGAPLLGAYSAAKAGVMGFTRSLAVESGSRGITCNSVCLGLIEREQMAGNFPVEQTVAQYPVGRMGTPADVAPAVLYLASEEASWVTGQAFGVNGGYVSVR